MSYAQPTINGRPPKKIYRAYDMEVVWRDNNSLLYKSPRMKHYLIVKEHVDEASADKEAVHWMLEVSHSVPYPDHGTIEVLPYSSKDRYTLYYHWDYQLRRADFI